MLSIQALSFYINVFDGKLIVNACCGIAKVNAAVCAQVMIYRFNVEAIINTGVAGGMDDSVKICDIVVSNKIIPHDLELRFLNNYPRITVFSKQTKTLSKSLVKPAMIFIMQGI